MRRSLMLLLLLALLANGSTGARLEPGQRVQAGAAAPDAPKPDYHEYAKMTRWLVHVSEWGVLSTLDAYRKPVGGVASFSDGAAATGRLVFYLTPMDEQTQHLLQVDSACALTVAEAQRLPGGCGGVDPEDPTCAKVTILGQMLPVPEDQQEEARQLLFERHPAMADWPADHGFQLFELHPRELHLLDWYGGMHVVSAAEYFAVELLHQSSASAGGSAGGSAGIDGGHGGAGSGVAVAV